MEEWNGLASLTFAGRLLVGEVNRGRMQSRAEVVTGQSLGGDQSHDAAPVLLEGLQMADELLSHGNLEEDSGHGEEVSSQDHAVVVREESMEELGDNT